MQTALITGATQGLGRALAEALAARGWRLVITARSRPALDATAEELGSRTDVTAIAGDVTDPEHRRQVVDAIETLGRLDLLVNNAARFLRKPIGRSTDAEFDLLFATNVRGAFVHSRAAAEPLAATRGAIVNVTSISGLVGMPNQCVYAMTKGALVQLTRQLAVELAPSGVRVNAVAPGAIDTDFIAEARAQDPDPAATAAAVLSRHPLGRISTPLDVARAIAFLASPEADGITGTILSVDGGYVAQ